MSDKLIALFPTTLLVTKYEADFKKEFKYIRGLEYDKQAGLMGLASGQLQAANESVAAAE